jgi:hypothetical protein
MKTHRLGSTLPVTASLLAFTLFLTGCPFGDCWGTADITVTVDRSISLSPRASVLCAEVIRINNSDVTGTSPEGLPLGPRAEEPRIFDVTVDAVTGTGQAHDPMTDPYPTWFYAFVDLNGNRRLDSGEPFGTDPKNPSTTGGGVSCSSDRYQGAITINRRLP